MDQFQEPGIANGSEADVMMMGGGVDICIAIREKITKRVAKFENDKLNKNTCRCYQQVFFINCIFYQEP